MANRITKLVPDDRHWLEGIVDAEVCNQAEINITRITDQVIERLANRQGEEQLRRERALKALAADGLRVLVDRYVHQDRSMVTVSQTGHVISLPSRVGLKAVNDVGQREKWYQQTLWWELPWSLFEEVVQLMRQQRDKLGSKVEGLGEILKLRELYPDTVTAGEACERIGIDPREFDLTTEAC